MFLSLQATRVIPLPRNSRSLLWINQYLSKSLRTTLHVLFLPARFKNNDLHFLAPKIRRNIRWNLANFCPNDEHIETMFCRYLRGSKPSWNSTSQNSDETLVCSISFRVHQESWLEYHVWLPICLLKIPSLPFFLSKVLNVFYSEFSKFQRLSAMFRFSLRRSKDSLNRSNV